MLRPTLLDISGTVPTTTSHAVALRIVRLSDAVGGLAVGGVIVLIALSLADNDEPATIDAVSPFNITTEATSQGDPETAAPDEPEATTTSEPTATTDTPTTVAATSTSPPPPSSTATTPTSTVLVQPNFRPFIEIQVLNAGARSGEAATVSEQLEGADFAPRPARDAAVPTDATTILYAPGRAVEAATVNQVFGLEPDRVIEVPPDDPNWLQYGTDLHVMVLLGPPT